MELTQAQQKIKQRREYVSDAYNNKPDGLAVTSLVNSLSKKFKVSSVTIYGDIKMIKKS